MPKNENIKKVLVIGSGPIIIGQAAEFDFSGSQACRSLKEEGIEVILINSNPATIMTDKETADKIYIEPIELEYVKKIIEREKPDGILASLGGQTGLNIAVQLANDGILDEQGIKLLGTSLQSIQKAEDRELFKKTMQEIDERVATSTIVSNINDGIKFAKENSFPIIIRPAYTLGGTGGGIAHNMEEFKYICGTGLKLSMINQVLLEQSVAGWKEIEYEVIRDNADNCIVVCNMENFDPVGVHTGDSIVFAPSQTLSNKEYHLLKAASLKIIRALDIKGGCNIQYALDPESMDYVVIEVNPRVSRSSALASKATGYPIARVTAKIAIGINLDEIRNSVTKTTYAIFEPAIDYVVAKVPRWPFDKFANANRNLSTQMKATGEVMAIGRTLEESLLKAIDSLDVKLNYQLGLQLFENNTKEELIGFLKTPHDEQVFAIFKALQKGISPEAISKITKIDKFFIYKLNNIVQVADEIKKAGIAWLDYDLYIRAKKIGFGDSYIANLAGVTLDGILSLKNKFPINPVYKMLDTCAGEFEAKTPYYYSTYEEKDDVTVSDKNKVVVIGSGPIRIGQGIEFDYCSVHSVRTLKELGYESIIINNNPETVSTDFDTSDKLYFEPLTKECILDVIDKEKPLGIIVQFGGQTAINLADTLHKEGVKILGSSVESIDIAEDRDKFLKLLDKLNIPIPQGDTAFSFEHAKNIANKIGYPVLVRPSYVLGGRAMEIIYDDKMLEEYMKLATDISTAHPILIDKYILGKELEVDGICDGEEVLIPGIMEHIERSGVHSGDSIAVYPPQTFSEEMKQKITDYTTRIAKALHIVGLFNIQFVIDKDDRLYVIEVNPRASRTVPILSKITGIPMVNVATKLIMGQTLRQLGHNPGLAENTNFIAVKAPVFSFSKLSTVDTFLGPEMKSTGEVMGVAKDYKTALYKAFIASGIHLPSEGSVLISVADRDKEECIDISQKLLDLGFHLYATNETCKYLNHMGIAAEYVSDKDVLDYIKEDKIHLVINTPTKGKVNNRFGFLLRRTAIEFNTPCLTSLDTTKAAMEVMEFIVDKTDTEVFELGEYSYTV